MRQECTSTASRRTPGTKSPRRSHRPAHPAPPSPAHKGNALRPSSSGRREANIPVRAPHFLPQLCRNSRGETVRRAPLRPNAPGLTYRPAASRAAFSLCSERTSVSGADSQGVLGVLRVLSQQKRKENSFVSVRLPVSLNFVVFENQVLLHLALGGGAGSRRFYFGSEL